MSVNFNFYNFEIPLLNGVIVEKFKEPNCIAPGVYEWRDKRGELHSFNGFPSLIRVKSENVCHMIWSNHGIPIKSLVIDKKVKLEYRNLKKNM